jgi:hypothetical protein
MGISARLRVLGWLAAVLAWPACSVAGSAGELFQVYNWHGRLYLDVRAPVGTQEDGVCVRTHWSGGPEVDVVAQGTYAEVRWEDGATVLVYRRNVSAGSFCEAEVRSTAEGVRADVVLRTPPHLHDLRFSYFAPDLDVLAAAWPGVAPFLDEALRAVGTDLSPPPDPWSIPDGWEPPAWVAGRAVEILQRMNAGSWRVRDEAVREARSCGPDFARYVRRELGLAALTPEQASRMAEAFGPPGGRN